MDGGERTLVIENGTLIDGSGRAPTPNEALVIEGNRIRSVGRRPGDIRREDAGHVEVIDAAGHWIMPGLIDAHTHLSYGYPHLRGEGRGRGPTRPELGVLKAAWSAQKVLRAAPPLVLHLRFGPAVDALRPSIHSLDPADRLVLSSPRPLRSIGRRP